MSCLLSGENESRNSANTGKLALFFQMQASSDPVPLHSDVSLSFALFGCNFTKIHTFLSIHRSVSYVHPSFKMIMGKWGKFSFTYF